MDKLKRYVPAAVDTVLTVVIVILLAGLIIGCITGEGFSVFGFKPVAILTGSMEPTIMTDAIVIVQVTDDYESGDIIMFRDGQNYIMHRYIADAGDGAIITKGDNNREEDLRTHTRDEVYGKVVLIMNWVSSIKGFLQ